MIQLLNFLLLSQNGHKAGDHFEEDVDAATQQQIIELLAEEREKQQLQVDFSFYFLFLFLFLSFFFFFFFCFIL